MSNFNAVEVKNKCVEWIRDFFDKNGKDCNAVVGISGGKDSSVVAALCVEALGKDRVIGVLMPNGKQNDIDVARKVVEILDIKSIEINISEAVNEVLSGISTAIYDGVRQGFDALNISRSIMLTSAMNSPLNRTTKIQNVVSTEAADTEDTAALTGKRSCTAHG